MEEQGKRFGMGWLPDYPDYRDYTVGHREVKPMLKKVGLAEKRRGELPDSIDLREWCPPVEDQGELGSCTANAGVGLVEYFERRAVGRYIDASRIFLYKVTRNLLKWKGDTGAFIRTTMGAMVLFGVPPEEYWPYVIEDFDVEPPPFCYAFAQNYQTLKYLRLDPPDTPRGDLLNQIKEFLAAGVPSMFGFTVYSSIYEIGPEGKIPFPCPGEKIIGGHAIVAVGYDDKVKIVNTACGAQTNGALLIRNSWGEGWGDKGYGWLPYDYVSRGLAIDWWVLLKNEWIDTGQFKL